MRNFLFTIAAIGAMIFTSCSSDDPAADSNGNGTMTFTVELPGEVQSRTFSDGTTATDVKCYVYDNEKEGAYMFSQDVTMNGLTGSVTLNLVNDHKYDLVFLATSGDNSLIEYTPATRHLEVKYANNIEANNEKLDAFYSTLLNVKFSKSGKTVKLKRPFAQLNIGTDDISEYEATLLSDDENKVTISKTSVSVSNIYTGFDLKNGEVIPDTEADVITFTAGALPASTEIFPVTAKEGEKQCQYLSMNYLLVPNDESLINKVTMTITTSDGKTDSRDYYNVPVRRNYRTNIYGTLLTTGSQYNVTIDPAYKGQYDIEYRPVEGLKDLKNAIAEGASNVKILNDFTISNAMTINNPIEIDLNNKTLDMYSPFGAAFICNADITLKNGTINIYDNGNAAYLNVMNNATVAMENIIVKHDGSRYVYVNSGCKFIANNCNLSGPKAYCIATNASGATSATAPVEITLTNSTLSGLAPVMLNVPGTLTINNCIINGITHGVIVRGGTATITKSEITVEHSGTQDEVQAEADKYNSIDWGSGTEVAIAALTMGNKAAAGSTSYQYPTVVTLNNTKLSTGKWSEIVPAVYAYGMAGDLGVTFTYDSRSTFTGATKSEGNVTVNGTAVTNP